MTSAQRREADRRTQLLEINKEAAKYFLYTASWTEEDKGHMSISKESFPMRQCRSSGLVTRTSTVMICTNYLRSKGL